MDFDAAGEFTTVATGVEPLSYLGYQVILVGVSPTSQYSNTSANSVP